MFSLKGTFPPTNNGKPITNCFHNTTHTYAINLTLLLSFICPLKCAIQG